MIPSAQLLELAVLTKPCPTIPLIRRNESTVEVAHEAVKTRVPAGVPLHPDHDSDEKNADGENNLQPRILADGPENEDEIQAGF